MKRSAAREAHDAIMFARPDALSSCQRAVAHVIVLHGGYGAGWCEVGVYYISLYAGLSVTGTRNAIAGMVKRGWAEASRQGAHVSKFRLTPVAADVTPAASIAVAEAALRAEAIVRVSAQRARDAKRAAAT